MFWEREHRLAGATAVICIECDRSCYRGQFIRQFCRRIFFVDEVVLPENAFQFLRVNINVYGEVKRGVTLNVALRKNSWIALAHVHHRLDGRGFKLDRDMKRSPPRASKRQDLSKILQSRVRQNSI